MARLRRQAGFVRAAAGALACCALLCVQVHAQYGGPGMPGNQPMSVQPIGASGPPISVQPPANLPGQPTAAGQQHGFQLPPPGADRVLEIRIIGNRSIKTEKVLNKMGTKVGHAFDQGVFENDIRVLHNKVWFVHVASQRQVVPGQGIVITLDVVERPTLEHVKFVGNVKIKPKVLETETGLKKGDGLDNFAVEEGKRKIEMLYIKKGFNDVQVTIVEGNRPGDKGAVFLINEGKTQKIWDVEFEGNTVASDDRLKTIVKSKKPILWVWKGQFDRKQLDDDVQKLTDYYRSLGFFKAHIGRDYEFNEKENWVTVTFFITEGPRYSVEKISFIGNDRYDDTVFEKNLTLKPGQPFSQEAMAKDVATFKDIYGINGFVYANAKPDLRFYEEPGKLDIVYQISEGKQYRAGDINVRIKGDNPHSNTTRVLNVVTVYPGDILNSKKLSTTEQKLKYAGTFNVDPSKGELPRVAVRAPTDDEEDTSNIAKRPGSSVRKQSPDGYGGVGLNAIAPGSGFRGPQTATQAPAGNPYVVAQPQPPASPYSNFSNGGVSQAQYYSQPGAAQAPGAVAQAQYVPPPGSYYAPPGSPPVMPAYTNPNYTVQPAPGTSTQPPMYGAPPPGAIYGQPAPLPPPGEPLPAFPGGNVLGAPVYEEVQPALPVDIILNEGQTGRFMFGAGVNSNAGLVGNIVIDEKNFDWRRFPRSWSDFTNGTAFRGAGQQFRIEAAPGTVVQRYLFSFTDPYLNDTPVSFTVSGSFFNRFYRDWAEQRLGGRTGFGYQFSPDLSGMVSVRAEDVLISDPRVNTVPQLNAVLGHTQLYGFMGMISHNTRDNAFLATEGHLIKLDFEYVIGTFQYPRFNFDARKHWLLRERPDGSGRHVLSFYNQFGISGNDTPIYENYFAGGFSTLRGFQFRGASPMVNDVEVGGTFQNLSTIEYMFPITADDMLRAVTFVDFGTVEPQFEINNFRVVPGFGLRITIPALGPAPIALDFGFPVVSAPTDLKQVFSFWVGFGR